MIERRERKPYWRHTKWQMLASLVPFLTVMLVLPLYADAFGVSLFTVGHSLTLLAGVLGGIRANPYLIDAIIGASVVYKAFENIGGFRRLFGVQPNTRVAVLVFGLFHFQLARSLPSEPPLIILPEFRTTRPEITRYKDQQERN